MVAQVKQAGRNRLSLAGGGLQSQLQGLIQPARRGHRPVDSKQGGQSSTSVRGQFSRRLKGRKDVWPGPKGVSKRPVSPPLQG